MSQFIPEPRAFADVTTLPEDVKKVWSKVSSKYINNLINDHTFLMDDPENGVPVTPCMDLHKTKIQSDGSLDQVKLRILVKVDLSN